MIVKADGPECPRCGCADTEQQPRGHAAGGAVDCRCSFCGETWTRTPKPANGRPPVDVHDVREFYSPPTNGNGARVAPSRDEVTYTQRGVAIVIYRPLKCPYCGSTNNRVDSNQQREAGRRHHHCRACERGFWSVEGR